MQVEGAPAKKAPAPALAPDGFGGLCDLDDLDAEYEGGAAPDTARERPPCYDVAVAAVAAEVRAGAATSART